MAIKNHTNPLYYIATEALNITENIANDPRRILVMLQKGSIMKVYSPTVNYFNTGIDGSYKTFPINAYNTYLDGDCWYDDSGNEDPRTIYMYARIDERDADADIIFTHILPAIYALDGIYDAGGALTDDTIHHILMGQMVYDNITNTYLLTWDSGDLGTDHAIQTGSTDLFEVVTDSATMTSYIQVLHDFLTVTIKNTLTLAGRTITKFLHGGDGTEQDPGDSIDPETFSNTEVMTSGWFRRVLDAILLRKDQDDSTPYTLTMGGADVTGDASVGGDLAVSGDASVGENLDVAGDTALSGNTIFGSVPFTPDSTGYGYIENQGGHFLQVENLKVLGKMEAKKVEIQEVNYVGGSIVLTPANGFTAVSVVPVDENFDETDSDEDREGYKLYYNRKKDDGTIVRNTWKVGDLAYCERWDLREGVQTNFETHRWWRKVLAVSTDYVSQNELDTDTELGWIVVSDVQRQMESLSNSVPMVDDKVVMLGHDGEDADRQTAIILSASQQYAPYIRMYKGVPVKSQTSPWYSLPDAFIDLNGRDTKITANTINISSSGETKNVGDVLGQLGGKLDHKFEIWQVDWTVEADAAPTLNDEPASSWTTAELRAEHEGDFIILSDGRCFQFSAVGQTYEWKEVSDKYLIDYVTMIGSKSSVFNGSGMREAELPKNYKANDIWVNCQYHSNGFDYRDEILVAVRDFSGAASINDWTTTNNYKADVASYKEAIENIVAKYDIQPDGKHETYFVDYDTTQYSSIAALLSAIEANWISQHPDQDAEDVKKEHIGDLCYVKPYTGYPDGRLYEYTRRLVEADGCEYYEYGWEPSNDAITKNMLMNIHDTQAAVDGKVNTFFYPSPSEITDYHQGDLLVIANNNGNPYNFNYMEGGEEKTKSYKDETLVCISDYNGSFSITDWKPIGDYPTRDDVNAMMEQYKVTAGLISGGDFADLYATATLNGVEVAGGHVTPKVTWVDDGDGTGHWESEVKIQANEVIVNGQTTFLSAVSDGIGIDNLATKAALNEKADPQDIANAISAYNSTIIEGNKIKTGLIDVGVIGTQIIFANDLLATNGTFTGTLSGVDGTFSGELSAATGTFGGTLNAAGGTFGSEYHGFSFIVSANEQKVDIVGPEFVVGDGTSEHPYEKASGAMITNSRYISLMNLIPTSYKTTDTSYTGIKGLAGQIRLFGTEGGYHGNTNIYRSYLEIDPYYGIVMGSEYNGVRTARCKLTPTGEVLLPATTYAEYASNAAAKNAGLPVGAVYRRGDFLCIVHD